MAGNNILLINPAINPKTQRKIVTQLIRATFPFSLGHLAGYLLAKSNQAPEILDDQIVPLSDEMIELAMAGLSGPKIVGITSLTATCARGYDIAGRIKAIDPTALIVLGGVHATVLPEEALSRECIDVVVRGEGEITFSELIEAVYRGRDYAHLPGISFKKDGNFVHNADRPLIEDLDSLPPFPYHLFEKHLDRYVGFNSIQTSRGCPYGCVFCSQRSISGRSYRYVSAARAIRDIETLVQKYHARTIRIMDDNIGVHKQRLMNLLDLIMERGIHKEVSFEAPMRADHLDEELADKLKAANFTLLTFGLETASERLMKLIQKGESVQEVVRAIRLTARKKISTGTTLIFGLPTETNRDRWDAIRLVSSLPLDSVRFNILTPYPGTPVYHQLIKENKITVKPDWENFSVQYMWQGDDLPYVPDGTNRYELMFLTMLANLWFYIRPSGLWKLLTKPAAGGNVIALKKRWYFSGFLFKILRVGIYLSARFLVVFFKTLIHKMAGKK